MRHITLLLLVAAALNLPARDSYITSDLLPAHLSPLTLPGEAMPQEPRVETDSPVAFPAMPVSSSAEPVKASSSDYVEIVHNKLRYAILAESEAYLLGWADSNDITPHLVIPDYVPYGGAQVPVGVINSQAFRLCQEITALTIGANVRVIFDYAFSGCEITELTIPSSVIHIGKEAFSHNPLAAITFENPSAVSPKLQIGAQAFDWNNLTTFEVPARMAIDGELSFANDYTNFICSYPSSLKSITINPAYGTDLSSGASRFEIIDGALCITSGSGSGRKVSVVAYPCANGKKSVSITDNRIDVFAIAFSYNPTLESVTLSATSPETVGEINLTVLGAFPHCKKLTSLSLSANGPISISSSMAYGSENLEAYTLSGNITNFRVSDGVIYRTNGEELIAYPPGKKNTEFTVPENVKYISDYSFYAHPFITTVRLPKGLLGIGSFAFGFCSNLKNIIYSGTELAEIGDKAFLYTPFINEAPAGPVMLGDWLVAYSGAVPQNLVIGPEVRHAVQQLFYNNQDIRSVVLSDNMETIPKWMFYGCQNLEKVTWPANLRKIEYSAFNSCGFEEVIIPEGVTTVMPYAFFDNINLRKISLPSTLTALGAWSFYQLGDNTIEEVIVNRATPPYGIPSESTEPVSDINAVHFFTYETMAGATLVLPQGVNIYAFIRHNPWNFANVENRDLGGIDSVTADNDGIDVDGLCVTSRNGTTLELWRMDGVKLTSGTTVTAPCAGIYLLRQGSATTKLKLSSR